MRFERLLLLPVVLASVACIEGQRVIKLRARTAVARSSTP